MGQGRRRSRAQGRQARRHRQQGAARPARPELAKLAEKNGVALNFEAAVAGGIPVIKTLREALAGNQIRRVYGILNGTCNYILTQMQAASTALRRRARGSAGQGLRRSRSDLRHRRLRHRPQARRADQPRLRHASRPRRDPRRGHPVDHPGRHRGRRRPGLPHQAARRRPARPRAASSSACTRPWCPSTPPSPRSSGVTNCVAIDGDFVGNLLLAGPGAGGQATASAVASDILDIARGDKPRRRSACRRPSSSPTSAPSSASTRAPTTCGSRCTTGRAPWPRIASRMGERDVSLESIVQRRPRGVASRHRRAAQARLRHVRDPDHARDDGSRHPGRARRHPQGWPGFREAADDTHRAAVGSNGRGHEQREPREA